MELGLALDDDSLFDQVTEKLQKSSCEQSYSIKNCYPLVITVNALVVKDEILVIDAILCFAKYAPV